MGQGAFGTVYEAQQSPINKRVALKVLHPEQAYQPEAVGRFLQEAETAARVRHPHIVDVYDVGAVEGVPYLAMEFLQGETLTARLRRERAFTPEKALDVMLPVFSAVAALHDRGIVHRDLKHENVFLTRGSGGLVHPKLLDFGVAKGTEANFARTRTGMLLGTPYFMSPEQARESKHVDARSDQWALAVMLYEALTGAKPFDGDSLLVLLRKITEEPPSPPRLLVPTLPAALEAALLRALEKDRARRFPTMREFGCALLPFASRRAMELWGPEFDPSLTPEDQAPTVARPSAPPRLGASVNREAPAPVPLVTQKNSSGFPDPAETMRKAAMEVSRERSRTPVPTAGASSRRWVFALGGVFGAAVLAVGVFAVVGVARSGHPPETHPTAPPPTPVPAEFALELQVEPPSAHITIDGVSRGEGAVSVRLPGGPTRHELRASADGYEALVLTFDEAHRPPPVLRLTRQPAPAPTVATPAPTPTPTPVAPVGARVPPRRTDRVRPPSGVGAFPSPVVFPQPSQPMQPQPSPTTSSGIPIR